MFREDGFKYSVEKLKTYITPRSRVLIINSPANSTGVIYQRGELEALSHFVIRLDLWVITDEIFEHLIYDNNKHTSIASLGDEIKKRTVLVNGILKSFL